MFTTALLLLSLLSSALSEDPITPALEEYCAEKTINTPCQYKCVRNDQACGEDQTYKYQHLSGKDVRFALHRHNVFRDLVAGGAYLEHGLPTAANMMVMSWDKQCEWMTACWILQCTITGHDAERIPVGQKGGHGQNLFRLTTSETKILPSQKDINSSCNGWFDEYKQLTPDYIDVLLNRGFTTAPPGKMIGHLTQMIWAETTHLGCAKYKFISQGTTGNVHVFCNYNPAGNVQTRKMYLTGPPASECPPGTKPNVIYKNLCGRIRRRREDRFVPPVDLDPAGTERRVKEEEEEALIQEKEEAAAAARGNVVEMAAGAVFVVAAVMVL